MKRNCFVVTLLVVAAFVVEAILLGLVRHALGASGESGYPSTTTPIFQQGYSPDSQTAAWRSGLFQADATSIATLTSTTTGEFWQRGRVNVAVGGRFSTASQTCKFRLLYEYRNPWNTLTAWGLSDEITLTGTSFTDGGGLYIAPVRVLDGLGATHIRVVLTSAPASGTVDLWVGSS